MCNSCGYNPCSCEQPKYSYNWNTIENYPCNPCATVNVCKKKIPAKCTFYNGPALTFLNLGTNIDLEVIIASFVSTLEAMQTTNTIKIANIQAAFDDVNARLNLIEGGSHPNYII